MCGCVLDRHYHVAAFKRLVEAGGGRGTAKREREGGMTGGRERERKREKGGGGGK